MSMTVSVRVEHRDKSRSAGQRNHDLRKSHVPAYVDKSRSQYNSVLIEPLASSELEKLVSERRIGKKRKLRSDAAIATTGILTFGREAHQVIASLSIDEQNELIMKACKSVVAEFDNELTGLVIHRDEQSVHAHFQTCSWNRNGLANSKVITPELASKLQDAAGACFSEYGIGRGISKEERIKNGEKPKHKSVKELHETESIDGYVRQANPVLFREENSDLLALEEQERIDEIIYYQRQAVEALLRDEQIRPAKNAERWIFQLHEEIERERKMEEIHARVDGTKVLEHGDESTVPLDKLFSTPQVFSEPEKEVFPESPSEKEAGAGGFDLPEDDSRPSF